MSVATDGIIAELEAISKQASVQFGKLNAAQLNWKPGPERWSVGQCLDHIITTNVKYFPQLKQIAAGEKQTTFWERIPVVPGLFGNFLNKAMQPGNGRKFKAPKAFVPSASALDVEIVEMFNFHQQELIGLVAATGNLDAEKIIVTSPAAAFVTLRLCAAFDLLVAHEQRHMIQANRVTETSGFPA